MIRFNCPHCNRYYELHPAMAHLPLLCKQCGERITPPEAVPEPPPAPVPAKAKPVPPVAEVAPPPPKAEPIVQPVEASPPNGGENDGVLAAQPDVSPSAGFNEGEPTAASPSDAGRLKSAEPSDPNRSRPTTSASGLGRDAQAPAAAERRRSRPVKAEPDAPPEAKSAPTLLPFIADLVAFVALIGCGMLLGELLVRKPTGQVLSEAGSAPKFPPVELLLWAASPVMLALVYLLLSGRQQSFGAWVRRRTAK